MVYGVPAPQPAGWWMRSVDAGKVGSFASARRGRLTNSPPQFGQMPWSTLSTQLAQNVHSNVQILASATPAGDLCRNIHTQDAARAQMTSRGTR